MMIRISQSHPVPLLHMKRVATVGGGSLSAMTHSRKKPPTYSVKSIFLLNVVQRLEAGDFVWMAMLVSFDLAVSRGLS